jgi:hypothetical protein
MPLYDWKCEKCGKWESTVYPIEERDTAPDEKHSQDGCDHAWERKMSGKQAMIKSARWGMGKGNW